MNNLLYNDGEKLIIKKKHLEEFLNDSIKIMQENEDLDEEELKYYQEENAQLLKITKDWNEEKKIGLYTNAMSGWFMIDQTIVEEVENEQNREKNISDLKGIIQNNTEDYLKDRVKQFYDWQQEMGASRVITYDDTIDWVYDDILEDIDATQDFEDLEIKSYVIEVVKNIKLEELENKKDIRAFIIK